MLALTLYCDEHSRIVGLCARGHADFAQYGEDIVCAAVSAILQAARLGLEHHARVPLEVEQRSGQMVLHWSEEVAELESVRAIVATAALAVEAIAGRFPEHVRLRRRRISVQSGRRGPRAGNKPGRR
ncbi:MAG: ribosomal-processing cysteine protease Prp [Candidatus Eremiobacteraeota bacterium]|nr:ribosomal-processing cysteine protease Prp [Candidatus Eremiobacteraeota bacterium]